MEPAPAVADPVSAGSARDRHGGAVRRLPVLAALALAATAGAGASAAPAWNGLDFSHHDWELACDNTGTCRAAGYSSDRSPEERRASVLVTRAAGPRQAPGGQVRFSDWAGPGPTGPMRLAIDGRDLGRLHHPRPADPTLAQLSPAQLQALLDALRGDPEVAFIDQAGQHWPLSTRGAMAVLLKLDEYQRRLHTNDALARRGKLPSQSAPGARPPPVVRVARPVPGRADDAQRLSGDAVRRALAASLSPDQECQGLGDRPAPLQVQRLSAGQVLVSTICWQGAYNEGMGYWVVDDRPPHHATLVTTRGTSHGDGRIYSELKGRGLGDCFSHAEWTWTGTAFVQTLEATTGMCRAIAAGGAWHLPTLVAEVVGD